jgi:secreted trypsin-like serine protease
MRFARTTATAASLVLMTALSAAPASAVVAGTPAGALAYPWLASIGSPLFFLRPSGQFCGGTLVAPDKVLTAAHCVAPFAKLIGALRVTFGRTDLKRANGVTVSVRKAWVHPGFHETTFQGEMVEHDDVAVLTLSRRLPRAVLPLGRMTSGKALVLGWGTVSESDLLNAVLRAARIPVDPDAACTKAYGSSFDARGMACAGSPRADTCLFDSGGPLILQGRVAGLTSWAAGCARPGFPGVYTRVSAYADDIEAQLR